MAKPPWACDRKDEEQQYRFLLAHVKKALAKPAHKQAAQNAAVGSPSTVTPGAGSVGTGPQAVVSLSAATIKKLTDSLRKMGAARPSKPASLRQSLKSNLGASANEEAITAALDGLVKDGVVKLDPVKGASYPMF